MHEVTLEDLQEHGISEAGVRDDVLLDEVERLRALGVSLEQMAGWTNMFEGAIQLALRRPGRRYTLEDATAAVGVDAAEARRIALALGVGISDGKVGLSEDEVHLLAFVSELGKRVGQEEALAFGRVLGSAVSRVAQAVVSMFRLNYELPMREAGADRADVIEAYYRLGVEQLPEFTRAVATILRRHLIRVSGETWATDVDRRATVRHLAVGFADLVDYTALVSRASVDRLVDAVNAFEQLATNVVVYRGGEVVKLLGDEVMFVAPDTETAVAVARRLVGLTSDDDRLPPLRVGLAFGEVVSTHGDYYGAVVNLAARFVGLASPGEIVATPEFPGEPLPPVQVRGFPDPVAAVRVPSA